MAVVGSFAVRRARVVSFTIVASLATAPASATPYETFVDVSDQADLEDLLAAGDLTQDTFDELLELLLAGVDLNTADRNQLYALPNLTYDDVDGILKFRDENGGAIEDPAVLVQAGVLSEDKLLAISAFLVVTRKRDRYNLKGWVRTTTRYTVGDERIPPFAMRGRFTAFKHAQAGFATTFTRLDVGRPVYDPARDALLVEPQGYRVVVPKAYIKYEDAEAAAIAGTYRIGFGQRLVFDNSSRYTPNGIYIDDNLTFSTDLVRSCKLSTGELDESPCSGDRSYTTPDWRWRDGLLGVAAGFKRLEVGDGWLQGYVWASVQNRRIYQYELANLDRCADPSNDSDPACSAPKVFVRPEGENLLTPSAQVSFTTLRDVFQERLAGGNVAYYADRRNSVGLTAYGSSLTNLVDGVTLDTQEWSRMPSGRRYGAAGANFSFGRDWLDVFGEAAISFDRIPYDPVGPQSNGGGPAAILRATATKKRQELEASLRYYSYDFVNPYARPISQPDTLDGQRARDELGFRLRYYRTDKQSSIRALIDIWEPPSQRDSTQLGRSQPKLDSYVRGDFQTSQQLRLGLWLRYQDKDLRPREGVARDCFEVSTEEDERGEPIPCGGRQLTAIGRVRYSPQKRLAFTTMLQHQMLDDPRVSMTSFRHDVSAWFIALYNPQPGVRLRARVRYLDEAVGATNSSGVDIGEESVSVLLDGATRLRKRDLIRGRIDIKSYLDGRASTLARTPNPELTFWLTYEARL
jgi:hypothetical protein